MAQQKSVNRLATFECLGVHLEKLPGGQAVGDCPFCGKVEHFFINTETGQWDCKRCGEAGNVYTFLNKIAEQTYLETHGRDYAKLEELRGIPSEAFREARLGWTGTEWWIPVYSEKGTVRDIRRWWREKELKSTAGCSLHLWGLEELAKAPTGSRVWICEGEWDGIALTWLLHEAQRFDDVVVAVPGASVFKADWNRWFTGHHVYVCYDNDQAGDAGSMKAGAAIEGYAASVKYLCWPDARPDGWDIRDFVKEGRGKTIRAETGVKLLENLMRTKHRRALPEKAPAAKAGNGRISGSEQPVPFETVVKVFSKWVSMDQDTTEALAVCLATVLSNEIPGDPLWLYLVGPPGGGKSMLLMALQTSEKCLFRSTLTPASLVSGFNVNPDPSLIPAMNGRTAVFKDGTELLAMHPEARREAYGVLRGAFDGHVSKSFGNGVKREYIGIHFSMLVGITPAVHADNQATMGERFLKFSMRETESVEDKIRAAISNISHEAAMQAELTEVCRRFLLRKVNLSTLPPISDWVLDRSVALAQLLSILRAQVMRESYGDRDILYRPSHEIGTRVAKQIIKLGQTLGVVLGHSEIRDEIYQIMRRVAFDTMVGFHLDVVQRIADDANRGLTKVELSNMTRIPWTTLDRKLADLEQLGVIYPSIISDVGPTKTGPAPKRWRMTEKTLALWERALGAPLVTDEGFRRALGGV